MKSGFSERLIVTAIWLGCLVASAVQGDIIVCEAERFTPLDEKGWQLTAQNDSHASHTYGGMWVTHGAGLGAPAASEGSVAVMVIDVPDANEYRVWSKYQAPPYFNYMHKIEIVQKGKVVFSHVYGRKGADRLWSFSGESNELWWFWGVDHDAGEAPKDMVKLAAGKAQVRLITVANAAPAADRFVDYLILTTSPADDYQGRTPYRVAVPFGEEALAATELYMRFENSTQAAAKLNVKRRIGHWQPQYSGAVTDIPEAPVGPGKWSPWTNIGPFCRLVYNEGLHLSLPGAETIKVQLARDAGGKDLVGEVTVPNGEAVIIPIDVTWNKKAEFLTSAEHGRRVINKCKTEWRTANDGKKPQHIAYYGWFGDRMEILKDALGYNTELPAEYERISPHALYCHAFGTEQITTQAALIKDKSEFRILSFGDEISLGEIDFDDPNMHREFRRWLRKKGYTGKDLGAPVREAQLTRGPQTRLAWYSQLFNEEKRFEYYREMTKLTEKLIGPHVLTGANYSPHHLALCYGPVFQWVDLFKHNGMSMFWAEDYIFSVPEVPQIMSWMLAETRCGVKYNKQPMLYYMMPHAPGQEAGFLRRDTLAAIGFGVSHIHSFCVAPQEAHTENYVAWGQDDTFRAIHEAIYDSAEAEDYQAGGTVRPARVAVVLSKATDYNESRLQVDPKDDPFLRQCRNAAEAEQEDFLKQTICRKDQQMLYLALRHAQHGVELITEDDIVDGYLKQYDVVYFAGEWIDHRVVRRLKAWVRKGGTLYATAGIGHLNEFGEREIAMMELLGLKGCTTEKNLYIVRTLLELPLAEPIGTITMGGKKIAAIGMKQKLRPGTAKVLGKWEDGSAAVTVNSIGRGKAFAVGTLAGTSYMKTALKVAPFARGGTKNLYNPVDFDPAATQLVRLGVEAGKPTQEVVCSNPYVEAIIIDNAAKGTLLTLVNWSNGPIKDLQVQVKLPGKPKFARSVSQQSNDVAISYAGGIATITTDLAEADFILLPR